MREVKIIISRVFEISFSTEDIVAVLFLAAISSSKPPTRIRSRRGTSHHRSAISLRIHRAIRSIVQD